MKHALLIFGMAFSFCSYAQESIKSLMSFPEKAPTIYQLRSLQAVADEDSANVIWYEDFREGLDGNNSSTNPAWSVSGDDGDVWELDFDGSNGDYAGNTPYLLESESAANGWMIFDADGSNAGLPTSAYSERQGQLTSPYIDLSNDSNVTLSFEHAYRWCCSSSHELVVSINDGSGWESAASYQVNDLGTVNVLSGTITYEVIITEIAALKDSVQIRFDWAVGENTASHYFWMVDDVKIIKTQPYASNLLSSFNNVPSDYFGGTSYRVMPLEQISETEYFYAGYIENVGYNTLDSLRIHAEVSSDGFMSQSYGLSLVSSDKDSIYVNDGFTPTEIGTYTADIVGKDDYGYVLTDTLRRTFAVSDYIYARDNGDNATNFGRYGINADGSRQYGNVFDIYATSNLYSIKFRLDQRTSPNAQGTIRINTVDTQSGEISFLVETETLNLGQYTGDWFDVSFDPPIILDAGQVVLPAIYATYNGIDTVFVNTSGSNPNNSESLVQDIDGTQDGVNPGTWLYTTSSACVRLNFDPNVIGVNVGIAENNSLAKFNVFPNPNNGYFNIQIQTSQSEDININISNLVGQVVYSEKVSIINALNKWLDLSYLEKGVYTVTLENNNKSFMAKKVTIQ